MSNSFVPLIDVPASAGDTATFQLTVLSQAEAKAAFEAMLADPERQPAPNHPCEPKVTLQRKGDVVCGIRIECGCGQVIELECIY
jgi:hypothetical protein